MDNEILQNVNPRSDALALFKSIPSRILLFLFLMLGLLSRVHAENTDASEKQVPQVLLIGGHSVSSPYPIVSLMLEGAADVHIVTGGANNTTRSLEHLDAWMEKEDWDLICFNWGLEDIRHRRFRTKPARFGKNLQALVTRMKASGAKLVFSTTPPVAKENRQRIPQEVIDRYNQVALNIVKKEDIEVVDIAALVADRDPKTMLAENGIQFSDTGEIAVGEMTAQAIAKTLDRDVSMKSKATLPAPRKKVLIIGDSISLGYHRTVTYLLRGEAVVEHAEGNNQGTTHGLREIDNWLGGAKWDVIHFNFGLHDLKHVDENGKNAQDRSAPQQADLVAYEQNLEILIGKLQATGAKLIFATTTPVPQDHGPLRDPGESMKYNKVALKLMQEHGITVNDLHSAVTPNLKQYQNPADVHFTAAGSVFLGRLVAKEIRQALK